MTPEESIATIVVEANTARSSTRKMIHTLQTGKFPHMHQTELDSVISVFNAHVEFYDALLEDFTGVPPEPIPCDGKGVRLGK